MRACIQAMSALAPEADIAGLQEHVCFVPKADVRERGLFAFGGYHLR
jgi:hypothetical protein